MTTMTTDIFQKQMHSYAKLNSSGKSVLNVAKMNGMRRKEEKETLLKNTKIRRS